MMNVSHLGFEEKIFWGFVAHLRWWLIFDGGELSRLNRCNADKLDSDSIKRIAKNYSVRRGIKADRGIGDCNYYTETSAEWLARTINEFDRSKHDSLEDKARWCGKIAGDARNENVTNGQQVSAITKLLWFRCQEGWTVYDSHASSAAGAKGIDTLARMKSFYNILSRHNFIGHAKNVDEILKNGGFGYLYGCRVIDAFLMLNSRVKPPRGEKPWPETTMEDCKLFLDCLPKAFRNDIVCIGKKIPKGMEKLLCNSKSL